MIYILAILLIINIFLNHGYVFTRLYYKTYKAIFKPKYRMGEKVIIDGNLYEVMSISEVFRPYTYFCLPVYTNNVNLRLGEHYYHESKLKKSSALLKELE